MATPNALLQSVRVTAMSYQMQMLLPRNTHIKLHKQMRAQFVCKNPIKNIVVSIM